MESTQFWNASKPPCTRARKPPMLMVPSHFDRLSFHVRFALYSTAPTEITNSYFPENIAYFCPVENSYHVSGYLEDSSIAGHVDGVVPYQHICIDMKGFIVNDPSRLARTSDTHTDRVNILYTTGLTALSVSHDMLAGHRPPLPMRWSFEQSSSK
ncbi:hypothetical protein PSPO01_02529 [Paraphaeosphaeria sporulosa]